jgi:hypothetical protein
VRKVVRDYIVLSELKTSVIMCACDLDNLL